MDWRTRLYDACPLLVGFFGFPKRKHRIVYYDVETVDGYFVWTVRK